MTFEQFRQILKNKVRKTQPDQVGLRRRYMSDTPPGLDSFVADLCYSFLRGDSGVDEQSQAIADDDDTMWYVEQFIKTQVATIRSRSDNEPLVLGLAAVAMIAPRSDPRDVVIWIDHLYAAAREAGVPEPETYFKKVADQIRAKNEFLAQRILNYPAVFEKFESEGKTKRANRFSD
jgi:hypothetical protein